jgi:hypothetical protein
MGLRSRWAGFLSSRGARRATAVLVILHLAGCGADLVSEQWWLMSALCLVSGSSLAELAGYVLWLVLALSWAVGLLAIRLPSARPAYWALLLAIPAAYIVQQALLASGVLSCDGP